MFTLRGHFALTLVSLSLIGSVYAEQQASQQVTRSTQINSGFLLYRGQYFPPPYHIEMQENRVMINKKPMGNWIAISRFNPEDLDKPSPQGLIPNDLAKLERSLERNCLLIDLGNEAVVRISREEVEPIIHTLVSDISIFEKVRDLGEMLTGQVSHAQLYSMLEKFYLSKTETERLLERLENLYAEENDMFTDYLDGDSEEEAPEANSSLGYSATALAMLLSVLGFGLAFQNPPPKGPGRWGDRNLTDESGRQVIHFVVLIVILGLFDLGCTLLASQSSGFAELNPLAQSLSATPVSLISIKMVTMLICCGILIGIRNYKAGHIASWWGCLLCTILTFRWATVNSILAG